MTNKIAIALGGIIAGLVILDWALNGGAATVFLGRKIVDLIDWLAFWR